MRKRKPRHITALRLPYRGLAYTIGCISIAAAVSVMMMQGCGPRTGGADEIPYDDSDLMTDTVVADTVPAEEPRLTFGSPEEMLRYMDESPDARRYHAGILPDMVRTAPEYVEELLNNRHPRFLIADKGSMRVIVYDSLGVEQCSFRMAAGKGYGTKHKRRDSRTPEGLFSVEGIYNSTDWLYTDDDGKTSQVKGQFGPRFIRLKIPATTQIGIHGTCAPWSVGGRRSHGCMRLSNDDIMELVTIVDKGMPVIVNPSARDSRVNEEEGVMVRRVRTGHVDPSMTPPQSKTVAADSAVGVPDSAPEVSGESGTHSDSTPVIDEPVRHCIPEHGEEVPESVGTSGHGGGGETSLPVEP